MISYEYMQFLNDKVLEYLPAGRVIIGNKINFKCPICGDSKKNINKKRGWFYRDNCSFYCFNCGTGMSGIKFLQIISGQDYADIKREYIRLFLKSDLHSSLSAHYEQPSSEPSIFELKSVLKPDWKCPLTDDAKLYLENRKVLNAPFLRDPLYSCCGKNNQEYILIPWVVNGVDAYYQLMILKNTEKSNIYFRKTSINLYTVSTTSICLGTRLLSLKAYTTVYLSRTPSQSVQNL